MNQAYSQELLTHIKGRSENRRPAKLSINQKVLCVLAFLIPFLFEPFFNNANIYAFKFLGFILVLAYFSLSVLYRLINERTFELNLDNSLLAFGALSVLPIITTFVYWQDWYKVIFRFQTSSFSLLLLFVFAVLALINFKEAQSISKLLFSVFGGYVFSSILSFIILILNIKNWLELPSVLPYQSFVINNIVITSVLIIFLAPLFYAKQGKTRKSLGIFISSIVLSVLVLSFAFNANIFLAFTGILFLVYLNRAFKQSMGFYIVLIFLTFFLGQVLVPKIKVLNDFKKDLFTESTLNVIPSTQIAFDSLFDNNPIVGLGFGEFQDIHLKYEKDNKSDVLTGVYQKPFSQIFDFTIRYGILFLVGLIIFLGIILGRILDFRIADKDLSLGRGVTYVSLCAFITTLLFYSFTFEFGLLIAISILFLSSIQTKNLVKISNAQSFTFVLIILSFLTIIPFGFETQKVARAGFSFGAGVNMLDSTEVERQLEGIRKIRDASKINEKEGRFNSELAQLYMGLFLAGKASENGPDEAYLKNLLDNIVSESNKSVTNEPESYKIWAERFALMEQLNKEVDSSATIDSAAGAIENLAPKHGTVLLYLAKYYVDIDLNRSMSLVEKAYKSNPNVPKVQLEYAKSLILSGKSEEGINILIALTEDTTKVNDEVYQEAALVLRNELSKK